MRKLLLFAALGTIASASYGQKRDFCGTYRQLEKVLGANPALKADFEQRKQSAEARDRQAFKQGYPRTSANATYTIPLVFHILHLGGNENISDAQVIDQVNILNRDFRKQNADTVSIHPAFKSIASDTKIEFRLATKDPNGNCTNGILHHYDADTYWDMAPARYKHTWDCSKYLNIYVVKSFGPGAWMAAYSSFPGTNTNAMDVIVSLHDYIGSIGTSNPYNSRIMTHEIGHWFDLHHVWGDTQCNTVCGDDGVNDTPVTRGFDYCPNASTAICTPGILENHQNYMEYSYCEMMFTNGQSARMDAALTSTVSGRNNLSSLANLIATGVMNPSGTCAPKAEFYSGNNIYMVCSGQPITLKDYSSNGPVNSRNWSASGNATISAASASVTSITFPNAGTETVTLVVANNTGSSVATRTVLVVNALPQVTLAYPESFEIQNLPANFSIINYDQDVTWAQTNLAASSGSYCYHIQGISNAPASNPDIIETPSYDFATDPYASLTFKYAYAKYNNTWTDIFKVMASKDCGATWQNIYVPTNASLANGSGGISNVPFFPTQAQFKTYTVTDHPNFGIFIGEPSVKFRFYFKEDSLQGYGNNFFIDDINFSMIDVGVNELTKSLGLKLYPNPAAGSSMLSITLSDAATVSYHVSDVMGRLVQTAGTKEVSPGEHLFPVNEKRDLSKGIYFVNVEVNGQRMIRKFIVE